MLNQTQRLYKSKSKSKILLVFICIFGLILYYGCGRDDDGGITDPTSFSISEATGNVKTSIVQSQKTIGDLKIGFAASHDYTMDYTVEDSETDEAKKLTKADFQLANKVLTAKDSVATKVKLVDSSAGPVEKPITINFTFKANDANLKNNTQTLSVEVKLTRAQTFTVGDDGTNPENKFLQDAVKLDTFVNLGNNIAFNAIDGSMTISQDGKEVTFENIKNSETEDINISKITKDILSGELPYTTHFKDFEITSVDIDGSDSKIAIIKLTFTPKDEYEFTDPTITVKFKLKTKNWIK